MGRAVLSLALLTLVVLSSSPAAAHAQAQDEEPPRRWGLNIWGLSYHVSDSIDYAAGNWGVGARYYLKPRHLFLEADALRNSNRGLVVPISFGGEIGIGTIGVCRFSALAVLAAAYYRNPRTDVDDVKWGPVPGATVGCRRIKANVLTIFRPSDQPLAAVVAYLTVLF
jgi:hypothetical protein